MTARYSPAAERNGPPILAQLQRLLPGGPCHQGVLLEIASGTGQHAAHCNAGLPGWHWQPTDWQDDGFASIQTWCTGMTRVRPPTVLNVLDPLWAAAPPAVDAIFCANLLHIAPWACTAGLMQGAARHLSDSGLLLTYGPYTEDGLPTAQGNVAFDADLRSRHADWGVRHLNDVAAVAARAGLVLHERVAMPSNNLLLVWGRKPAAA